LAWSGCPRKFQPGNKENTPVYKIIIRGARLIDKIGHTIQTTKSKIASQAMLRIAQRY
jgi:hypothetical protein